MAPPVSIPPIPPSHLSSELRSSLISALLSTSMVPVLHSTLLSSCQSSGWLDAVRERTMQLLRNGDCGSYSELMEILVQESRGRGSEINGSTDSSENQQKTDIKIPERVVADGMRKIKEALDKVVEIENAENSS